MPERTLVGFVHNPRVPEAAKLVAYLVKSLDLEGSNWVSSSAELDVSDETLAGTQAIITAGGDGTILRVVRIAAPHSVPILGINLGRVGFMAELTVGEAAEKVPRYLDGSPRVEERMMLQASVTSRPGVQPHLVVQALNDVVVSRGAIVRLLDIETKIDGALLTTYRADGVITATPTGSTGYALSAGGPVLHPEARELLVQPIAAHMSFQTGIVISSDSVIELRIKGEHDAVLSADGFSNTVLSPDDRLTIRRSPHSARFLRKAPPAEFYATLTQGLGVSGRQVPLKR
jgi:NAD+ kinase